MSDTTNNTPQPVPVAPVPPVLTKGPAPEPQRHHWPAPTGVFGAVENAVATAETDVVNVAKTVERDVEAEIDKALGLPWYGKALLVLILVGLVAAGVYYSGVVH